MTPAALLGLALVALGAPNTDAQIRKKAEALVAQLGDPDFRDRERAGKALIELGYAAREAVLAGQKSSDHEISERCKKLYPIIWRIDLEKRVQKFLDNPGGPIPDGLPWATRWVAIAGGGKESRELYAAMVKANPEQLQEVELHPDRLAQVLVDLMRNVYSRIYTRVPGTPTSERPTATEAEVLMFLFLGAAGEARPTLIPGISSTHYYQFLNSPALTARLAGRPAGEPLRRLYAAWLEKERYTIVLRRGIDIAAQHGVQECAPVALKIASDPRTIITVRATALIGFSKLGTKDQIKDLAPFLADKTQIARVTVNGELGSVQMRDVALGAAVQLAGQNMTEFGFERRPPSGALALSSYTYYAFGTDEKREAAQQKWKEWAEKNLKK
ncbi:MAG TPA: hypothetical protein VKD90_02960 [Gemmataceae bacterium]|nr:hypothetical protein [Gemmataceae bacterium]